MAKKKTKTSSKTRRTKRTRGYGRYEADGETLKATLIALAIILVFVAALAGIIWLCGGFDGEGESASVVTPAESSAVNVHFIDVGNADCALIECADGAILIDAGEYDDFQKIAAYLNERGIERLNYVIATHAHGDHMGAMDDVILKYKVDQLIIPTKSVDEKFYNDVIGAARRRSVPMRVAAPGETLAFPTGRLEVIDDGSDVSVDESESEELNNNSYILKFTYGDTAFLFTGDAESRYEREMIANGRDLDADVLKVSHHGSNDATCDDFLKAVTPEYAVIPVGRDNSYGHPSKKTVSRLERAGAKVYRTDELGDVVVTTDGKKISITRDGAN